MMFIAIPPCCLFDASAHVYVYYQCAWCNIIQHSGVSHSAVRKFKRCHINSILKSIPTPPPHITVIT